MRLLEEAKAARLLKTYDQNKINANKIFAITNIDMGNTVHSFHRIGA
jgi:hypothetical protein